MGPEHQEGTDTVGDELDDPPAPEPWEDDPATDAVEVPESYTPEQFQQGIAAAATAAAEKATADARAAAEAEFNERRSHFDRRDQRTREALSKAGLALTDEGPAVTDLTKVLSLLGMGAAKQQDAPADETDWYDPIQRQAAITKQAEAVADTKIAALKAELLGQLGPLAMAQGTLIKPLADQAVASSMDALGVPGLQNLPAFREAFEPYFSELTPDRKSDPAQVRSLALYVMGTLDPAVIADARTKATAEKAAAEKQAERDRQRNALGQYAPAGATRSATLRQSPEGGDTVFASAHALVREALSGHSSIHGAFDEEMHRAMAAPDLPDGRSAADALTEKRAKAGARR